MIYKLKKSAALFLVFVILLASIGTIFATEVNAAGEITIKTTLEDGETIKGSIKTFDLEARDENKTKIWAEHIEVLLNGEKVYPAWDDSTKTSYKLGLSVGENNVSITVNYEGETQTASYTLYHTGAEPGEVIGQATFAIDTFTIGSGYIIEPIIIDIHEGERSSVVLDRLIKEYGYEYEHTGSLESSFYLSYILGFYFTPDVPDILDEIMTNEWTGNYDQRDYEEGELGEFNFSNGSGWMYSVNNIFPNVGFADTYLNDGDVVRVQYTLAYGADIGGSAAMGGGEDTSFYPIANKDALTTEVALINSSAQREELLGIPEIKSAYDHAMGVLANLSPGQEAVDTAYTALREARLDGEEDTQELTEAKARAKAELEEYKNPVDYREAQQAELTAAIDAGKEAIDAAVSAEAVNEALKNAKSAIDNIKTDTELKEEEAQKLEETKAQAKAELEGFKNPEDYREAQQAELAAAIAAGKEAIDAATDAQGVADAVSAAKIKIMDIKTDAQLKEEEAAKELEEIKTQAKAELESYKDAKDYREAQKAELAAAINAGKKAIEGASNAEEVTQALTNAKSAIDSIKTDAEITAEEEKVLKEAKEKAIKELKEYKNAADYREAEKAQLAKAIAAGQEAIEAATDLEGVTEAKEKAKSTIDAIKTDAQLREEEKDKDGKDDKGGNDKGKGDKNKDGKDKDGKSSGKGSGKGSSSDKGGGKTFSAKTGDDTPIMAVGITLIASITLLLGILIKKQRNV